MREHPGASMRVSARDGRSAGSGPVRVLHVLYSLRMGGTELGVVKLANALESSRVASAICSCKPADAAKDRLKPGIPLHEFDRRDGNDPVLVIRLARLFRALKPHIVHTHSWGTLCEGLAAARIARVPHIVHGEHGTMEARSRNLRVQRWAWARVDRVLSVSSRLADQLSAAVGHPRARIDVIRNGVDTSRFTPDRRDAARRLLDVSPTDVVVGTAGRLVPVKDQATLLAALARLRAEGLKFRAFFAGDGPLRAALGQQALTSGLDDRVMFLGARDDIEDVLAACDVFVLSSVSEGLSNTIQEAMASGVPVVATSVGGADELVEDGRTGYLVPPSDPNAMAAAIGRLVRNVEQRRALGSAGRRRATNEFSLGGMVHAYEQLYLQLAGRDVSANSRQITEPICVG